MGDAWDLPSGRFGPEAPYILDVLAPKWGLDPKDQNNPTVPRIKLSGRTDDPDWEEYSLDLRVEKEGWNIVSNGAEIRNDNPRKKSPSGNTQYGRFVNAALSNEDEAVQKLVAILKERGNPTQAGIWAGLRLVIGEVKDTFTDRETDETREFYRPVIIGFEGQIDDGEMQAIGQESAKAQEELENGLAKIAKEEKDHASFANRALNEFEISDAELVGKVMDASDDGFYAQHNK